MHSLPFSYATRNLFRDPLRLFQKVLGAASVVFLMLAASAFNRGMEGVLMSSGSPLNIILLGAGSEESIERSEVMVQSETLAASAIDGLVSRLGRPAVSGEVHVMGLVQISNVQQPEMKPSQALLRGVTPIAFEVHSSVRVIDGDYPRSGEILVGRLAYTSLGVDQNALAIGESIVFEGQRFLISGHFEAPGSVMESELWLDRTDLMTLLQRDALSCIIIRVEEQDDFKNAELFCQQRLDLELFAIRESDYYAKLAGFYAPLRVMAWVTAALVAAGALFGGLNLLYATFASRIRELATLQAIGFRRRAILWSLIQESLLFTLTGTLISTLCAQQFLEGVHVPFSIGTFRLQLTPLDLALGVLMGILLGTLGTLPPAYRCLGTHLPKALRSS